jgi:PAS domain S-box-containing protein
MLTDTQGKLVYVNPAWTRTYGYTAEEAIGDSPRLLRSRHQDEEFYRAMWAEITNPGIRRWSGELINRNKDGREIPVHLTITPYCGDGGEILGYMGIAINLTEKKQLLAQIMHQDRLASVGMLASGLAHEIGTPLGVIRGRAEYIAMMSDDSAVKSGLDIIISQIDRISKLIYSLLNVARHERSESVHAVTIEHEIQPIVALISQKLKHIGAELVIDVPKDALVYAEADRLQQVLLNLAVNAVHAMETAFKAGRKYGHRLSIVAHDQGDRWEVTLSDTGCGISAENMKHLFKPFFTTKDVGTGTGLGLAITYQIVHSWGGVIDVTSEADQGTEFKVSLRKVLPAPGL